ncbi:MAG TPA: 5-oxoprolinase subunit PxpB [Candidatus Cryosericum sp.]|nr:5-oxoprolinase subunit PxpB [Candidatus Cryosericum sp.]
MYSEPRFLPAGDQALVMELGDAIEEPCSMAIRSLVESIRREQVPGVRETIPSYRSILVLYDPMVSGFDEMVRTLAGLFSRLDVHAAAKGDILVVPVLYGGEAGPDLPFVAEHAGMSEEEVIALHASRDYLIYMLGFTPGFTYLGGMDERIATPRLERPRERIPAGSVGIAGKQTGIYPIDSPGGWRLIGLTPMRLYDPHRDPPILPSVGGYIRFRRIDGSEFSAIAGQVERGEYQPEVIRQGGAI